MITLNNLTYRNVKIKIVRDSVGTGYKINGGRAVWLEVDSPSAAENAAKQAIDKKLGV